jgi:hypothetical protein
MRGRAVVAEEEGGGSSSGVDCGGGDWLERRQRRWRRLAE